MQLELYLQKKSTHFSYYYCRPCAIERPVMYALCVCALLGMEVFIFLPMISYP